MSTSNFSNVSSSDKDLDCGALYEPYMFKISLIVVYCMVLLVGLTENALAITLVYRRKDLRKTINQLIANMAFSDFVFELTFIPVELAKAAYGQWPFTEPTGSIVCKIQSFVISTSVYVSVQSLTWIALDRFIAVVFPMKVHLISSRFRVLAIASSWIVAVLCGSVFSIDSKVMHKNGALDCTEKTTTISQYAVAASSFASLISITVLYSTIAVTLRRKNKALPTSPVTCEWKRSEKAASHENVNLRRGSLLCMFYPCHYYCLAVRKGTGNIMFVTQSTMATTWCDDQPFRHGKSNNLFHLCRKLPAWPERILWFVSDEMLEEKTKNGTLAKRPVTKTDTKKPDHGRPIFP